MNTLRLIFCFFLTSFSFAGLAQTSYPAWAEGILEIHHISTGRGDAAFMIMPDGTTLLIDAGDTSETHPRTMSARNVPLLPNRSKTAPQWIIDYIKQFHPKKEKAILDYVMITHYHDDHFGEIDSLRKYHPKGNYALTGIMAVGSAIPIKKIIDRGDTFPLNLRDKKVQERLKKGDVYKMIQTLEEYWKFIEYQKNKVGLQHETLKPGALNQLQLKYKGIPNFHIRNIAVNGKIWNGINSNYFQLYEAGEYPGENSLSTVIKLSYGDFDYYTGGDIKGINSYGETSFESVESHVAPVIGAVDVATLNHHGNRDSQNKFFVRTLRPRVWIGQTWSSDHPGHDVLARLLSEKLYPGERDLFSTGMTQANKDVIGGSMKKYKSLHGHIVVRVYDNGAKYDIFVLNERSEKREVKAKYGPYESR